MLYMVLLLLVGGGGAFLKCCFHLLLPSRGGAACTSLTSSWVVVLLAISPPPLPFTPLPPPPSSTPDSLLHLPLSTHSPLPLLLPSPSSSPITQTTHHTPTPPPTHSIRAQTGFVSCPLVVWCTSVAMLACDAVSLPCHCHHRACCPWRRRRRCFFRHEEEQCTCAKPVGGRPLGPTREEFASLGVAVRRLAGSVMWHQGQAVSAVVNTAGVPLNAHSGTHRRSSDRKRDTRTWCHL